MKRIGCILLLIYFMISESIGQAKDVDKLLLDFQSTNWPTVLKAKENLENYEGLSIPGLIDLLKQNSEAKLINTSDLIYPGAERFFGHGKIIDYDIDKIDIRAGWLIEDLAFQNFGFSGIHIEPDRLNDFIRFNFPKYYNNSQNRQKLQNLTDEEKRDLIKKLSIQEVEEWWRLQSNNWQRINELINALSGTDEKRQAKALFYIRNGTTKCIGLTKKVYKSKIHALINNLAKSNLKRISEQAKLILLDTNFEWMDLKTYE